MLDDTLVASAPRHDATRADLERILRQRTTLLKQAGGRLTPDIEAMYADYAPEKSNQLLDDIGLKKGADGYRTLASGRPLEVSESGH